ncbi:MAG TPA: Gfo/Idh/MocA family oxidoreductase [Lactobacillaceae bacterium]|jgi:predicted dehydrogenase
MANVKVGLIGFGIAGQVFHQPIFDSVVGFELVKVYERRPENIALLVARGHDSAIVTQNIDDIFTDATIDLVILAVPNSAHETLTQKALEAGKHVVVEKPFTIDTAAADRLIALSQQVGKHIFVHHNRRFDSDFLTVQQVLAGGELGELVEYEAHYDRFRNYVKENSWREEDKPGSGILYDLGAHLIDQALQLFGKPNRVFADVRYQRPGSQTIDNFEILLDYPKIKVTLKAGMLVQAPTPHFTLTGQLGQFVKYGMDVQEAALKAGVRPADEPNWGVEPENLAGKLYTEKGVETIVSQRGDYREFYAQVLDVLQNNHGNPVPPQQGRDVIRVIELAQTSHQTGAWVAYSD